MIAMVDRNADTFDGDDDGRTIASGGSEHAAPMSVATNLSPPRRSGTGTLLTVLVLATLAVGAYLLFVTIEG
jgi:hypothetical protein